MSEWNVWVIDTVTGVRLQRLPVSSFTWGRGVSKGRGGSMRINLLDSTVRQIPVKSLTTPVDRTLVLSWGDMAVYAGVIWTTDYDRDSGVLTVTHEDLWSILKRRLAVDHFVYASSWSETITGSVSDVMKRLIQLAVDGPALDNMSLPVVYPPTEGGALSRVLFGYHFPWAVDQLEELTTQTGANMDLTPVWEEENWLRWYPRILNLDHIHEWHVGVALSDVTKFRVKQDATKQVTSAVAIGEGSEADMLARTARLGSSPGPFLERVSSHKQVSDGGVLQSIAEGELATYQGSTVQFDFGVRADGNPTVADIQLGDMARLFVTGDPWVPTGTYDFRIVGMTGDLGLGVDLEVQAL